jgi:hypothetical protein
MIKTYKGELEVDTDRGVIYFHDSNNGMTRFRICRIGEMPEDLEQIDVTPIRDASLAVGFSHSPIGGLIFRDQPSETVTPEEPVNPEDAEEGG